MKVNVVTQDTSWILKRIAEESIKYLDDATITDTFDLKADINFFVNYAMVNQRVIGLDTINVAYFTHKDPKFAKEWERAEKVCKAGVYMAERYKPNVPITKKIYPTGLDKLTHEKLIIGVAGRVYDRGRKGEDLLREIDKCFPDGIEWRFLGRGWDSLPWHNDFELVQWESDEKSIEFYQNLDLFICASKKEGGPIPIMEAIKCGVPIISTDVGNREEWEDYVHIVDGLPQMGLIVDKYIARKECQYKLSLRNWDWFAQEHKLLFEQLYNDR